MKAEQLKHEFINLKSDEYISNLFKPYVVWLIIAIGIILPIGTMAVVDVNKQEKVIANQSNTILQLTSKVIEQQVLLSEVEELLRLREDLSKVLP